SEINKLKSISEIPTANKSKNHWISTMIKIAAGIALIIAGAFLNNILQNKITINNSTVQLNEIKSEVKDMKKMLMFTLLDEESPGKRIKAINYAEEIPSPDIKVLQTLIKVLNNDKNENVKLAAAYTLSKFIDNPMVRDS